MFGGRHLYPLSHLTDLHINSLRLIEVIYYSLGFFKLQYEVFYTKKKNRKKAKRKCTSAVSEVMSLYFFLLFSVLKCFLN